MWRWADVKMRCCEDEQMWRWADVKMWRWEDVKMRRCENEKVWRWEDEKMRRCEDEKVWRWEEVNMRRCEDEKMWRWEDERQTPTIGRTPRPDAFGNYNCVYLSKTHIDLEQRRPEHAKPDFNWLSGPKNGTWKQLSPFTGSNVAIAMQHDPGNIQHQDKSCSSWLATATLSP